MKKRITNNLGLKIVSVIIAVLMWLVIANINDPIVVKSYNLPVNIVNSAYIESIGKSYQVEEEKQLVAVILRGRSSLVEGRANDIEVVADLTQIVNMETKPYVMVPITATCKGIPIEDISVVPGNIEVKIEDVETQEFVITVNNTEDTPAAGYELGTAEANPEKVTVSGPESLMKILDRVVATVDIGNLAENVTKTSRLKVYDKNGTDLSDVQMGYLKFEGLDDPIVDVDIELWQVTDDVELKVNYTGLPESGYNVDTVTITPSKISVAGTEEALALLAENNNVIEVPEELIDVNGRSGDFEVKLELAELLPSDTKLKSGDAQSAIVHVSVIPMGSKQFTIPTTNISTENWDEDSNLNVVFDKDRVTVIVTGDAASLTLVNENTVRPVIDLEGKGQGDHTVPVSLSLPEGCELLEAVEVLVHIVELE